MTNLDKDNKEKAKNFDVKNHLNEAKKQRKRLSTYELTSCERTVFGAANRETPFGSRNR